MPIDTIKAFLNQPIDSIWVLGVSLPLLAVFLYLAHRQQYPYAYRPTSDDDANLQRLSDEFAQAGIHLNAGIKVTDLVADSCIKNVLDNPLLLLYDYGSYVQKRGQWLKASRQVIHFDYECIEDGLDSYLSIIEDFITLIAKPSNITYSASIQGQKLHYTIGQSQRIFTPKQDDDWADELVITQILNDITLYLPSGQHIFTLDDGQSRLLVQISEQDHQQLQNTIGITLTPWVKTR